MIRSNNMKEQLPDRPLKPSAFAKEMGISQHRLVRVANSMSPALRLQEGGEIPVFEYERLYKALHQDNLTKQ